MARLTSILFQLKIKALDHVVHMSLQDKSLAKNGGQR